jgi:hypothetical protein
MTNQPDAGGVFNPFLLWTDLGMRAAEMTVASLQNLTEGADRLTRAGASAEVEETDDTNPRSGGRASPLLSADPRAMVGMQRLMWDLMTQNWLNWTSAVSKFMSAGAGVGLARKLAGQQNPLQAVRDSLQQPLAWAEKPATEREAGSTGARAERRKARGSTEDAQHALAASESKPRRKAAAKSRRTQRSSRK